MRSTDRRRAALGILFGFVLAGCARPGGPAEARTAPVAVEYPTYATLDEMRHDTDAVVVAETTGDASPRAVADGKTADYFQRVRVLDVLAGSAPPAGELTTIIRLGLAGPTPRGGTPGHVAYGPLDPGQHVLFLRPAGDPGAWSVVGHFQGDLPLVGGRTGHTAFGELSNRTPEEIETLLAKDADHPHE